MSDTDRLAGLAALLDNRQMPDDATPNVTMGDLRALRAAILAPTLPDALDLIAAVRKAFDSGARLKHKADDPTSSYDPLARETVVLAALRVALEDADRE